MQLVTRDSLRIVHVEDDHNFAELSAHYLKRAGFIQPIVHRSNGFLAVRYFSAIEPQAAPHVILLDLNMPGMDGLEVLHWVRHNSCLRDVAVYLLTSSDDPEHQTRAMADGVTAYLIKSPFLEKLIEELDQLIAKTNQHRQALAKRRRKVAQDRDVSQGASPTEI